MPTRNSDDPILSSPLLRFKKSFPTIKDLTVDVVISDGPWPIPPDRGGNILYTMQNPPALIIPCPSLKHDDDGFDLGKVLSQMVSKSLTVMETTGACQGREFSHGGKTPGRSCPQKFRVKIVIQYHD